MADTGDIELINYKCDQSPDTDSLVIEEEFDNLGAMMFEATADKGKQRWPIFLSEENVVKLTHHLVTALNKRGHRIALIVEPKSD